MRVWGLVWLAGLILLAPSSAGAATPVQVVLRPTPSGVEAVFTLPEPLTRFALEDPAEVVRADTWHVATPDVLLAEGAVFRSDGKAFKRFTILITPDSQPRDRRYPALTRIGQGWQLYGPYFQAAAGQPAVEARLRAPRGWTALPAAASRPSLAGYVYLGPAAQVAAGPATLIAAAETPARLGAAVARAASEATALYTKRLGVGLGDRPTVMIALIPQFETGWQGDTTAGPVASLRFFGAEATGPDAAASDRAVHFVDHEFFHFWNSRIFHSRDGANEAWLHEGMAEYAALLASRQAGAMSEAQVGEALGGRLTGCANALGDKGMLAEPPRRGGAVYDCGVLVQWMSDLKTRRASNGARDVFDLWRELFAEAGRHDNLYDGAGFLARAGMGQADYEPLGLLMRAGEADRWTRLTARLEGLGARMTPARSESAERATLVGHVLAQVCKGGHGYYGGDPKALKLDTEDRCGVLNGDPRIDAIAGRNIMTDIHAAFDAAGPICAANGDIVLSLAGQTVATVRCETPMPPRPLAWDVAIWR